MITHDGFSRCRFGPLRRMYACPAAEASHSIRASRSAVTPPGHGCSSGFSSAVPNRSPGWLPCIRVHANRIWLNTCMRASTSANTGPDVFAA